MIWLWWAPKSTGAATHESTIIAAASAAPPLHADAAQARHRSLCACVDRLISPPLPPVACRLPLSCALARAGRAACGRAEFGVGLGCVWLGVKKF